MKIEDKAKAYDEMVQRVKELHETGNFLTKKQMEIICPELAESEDEKIRKSLIGLVEQFMTDERKEKTLAWLEKMKEYPTNEEMLRTLRAEYEKGVADTIVKYEQKEQDKCPEYCVRSHCIGCSIYEKQKEQKPWKVGANAYFTPEQNPADYNEYKMLIDGAREDGKINGRKEVIDHPEEYGLTKQKSVECSEEDKEALDMCLDVIPKKWKTKSGILLTKWLKDNIYLQPKQEWSDKDKTYLSWIIECFDSWKYQVPEFADHYQSAIDWLKSLCPQLKQEWNSDYREDNIQTRFAFYTYKEDPCVLYLSNVFVEESSRNHGFGTRILKAAEKVAEVIGAITISLKVKQNSPANTWYRKNGYSFVTSEDGYDWLKKNLEYFKPKKSEQEWSEEDKKNFYWISTRIQQANMTPEYSKEVYAVLDWLKSLLERFSLQPKQEWNDEDQKALERAIDCVRSWEIDYCDGDNSISERLKSFFERFNLQPKVEWSEEDDKDIAHIIRILDDCYDYGKHDLSKTDHENLVNKLKSIYPQSYCKLSEWNREDRNIHTYLCNLLRGTWNKIDKGSCIDDAISWLEELPTRTSLSSRKLSEDEERLIKTSISFLKDFADKGYENAVECIDWLKSKL